MINMAGGGKGIYDRETNVRMHMLFGRQKKPLFFNYAPKRQDRRIKYFYEGKPGNRKEAGNEPEKPAKSKRCAADTESAGNRT